MPQTAPSLTPAALPRVRAISDPASDVPGLDDLERGRTAALLASLGRVQLTLDLIERRLGRLEASMAAMESGLGSLESGVADVPNQTLLLLDVVVPVDDSTEVGSPELEPEFGSPEQEFGSPEPGVEIDEPATGFDDTAEPDPTEPDPTEPDPTAPTESTPETPPAATDGAGHEGHPGEVDSDTAGLSG